MKAFTSALFLALFSVLMLAGCGQKGPLFLPGQAPESQTEGPFGLDDNKGDEQSSRPDEPVAAPETESQR